MYDFISHEIWTLINLDCIYDKINKDKKTKTILEKMMSETLIIHKEHFTSFMKFILRYYNN